MAMAKTAFFTDDGGDPRLNSIQGHRADYVPPVARKLHDPNVTFEEYLHYASLTRAEENEAAGREAMSGQKVGILQTMFPSKSAKGVERRNSAVAQEIADEKIADPNSTLVVSDKEWTDASRALRTATWGAVFYLITTDILGPYGLPFAFATTGYGPGVGLYTALGITAYYSGWMLWKMFMGLDSYQYPLRTYGDLGFRIYGKWARYGLNLLQSVQLLCNVGVIIIGNGQGLSQVAKFKLCFAICCLVWAIIGFGLGQIRTLQKFGWLANSAVWMNIFVMIVTMAIVGSSAPNYAGAQTEGAGAAIWGPGAVQIAQLPDGSYPPVFHTAGLPNPGSIVGSINGLMQAVYAYGGAMLFTEFLAEMKRPNDFLKAFTCSSAFIYAVYMLFGLIVYSYQGQYTVNPANQGISGYAWQTVGNVIGLVSSVIAAALYGNIGIKVLYNNILMEWFKFPSLTEKKGKIMWTLIVPIYWSVAFIIAASIPNFFGLTSVVAAFCILHFTYTFPPLLYIGYMAQKCAIREGEGFDASTGQTVRQDTGIKRFVRGFFAGGALITGLNFWNILYALGALATAGMGAYTSIEAIRATFEETSLTSFTCRSPLDSS